MLRSHIQASPPQAQGTLVGGDILYTVISDAILVSDRPRILMITGAPGVGKTTVLQKTINNLKAKGFTIGGILSREMREKGQRIGFELIDLGEGTKGTLASESGMIGPRIGKYRVNLKVLADIGVRALQKSLEFRDITIIDEIGPMELFSPEFKRAVQRALESDKPVLGVLHRKINDPLANTIRNHPAAKLIEVTLENRSTLADTITDLVCSTTGDS